MNKIDVENCYFYKSDDGGLRIDPKDGEVKIYTKEELENDLVIVGTESNTVVTRSFLLWKDQILKIMKV